jgi:hypothetical protein
MSEYAGTDPRATAAEAAADPAEDERDATQVAEDPTTPAEGEPDTYS